MRELGPGIVMEGAYAQGRDWFVNRQPITFERRTFNRVGAAVNLACEDLKEIGQHLGVTLFALLDAGSPLGSFFVPISPGRFQMYMAASPPRR
jgi:hypothetical protein